MGLTPSGSGTRRGPSAQRDGPRISACMSETRAHHRSGAAVDAGIADDLSRETVAELLALQSRRGRLRERIDEVRRERSLQADCIGELRFQDEAAAARTHEERMAALGEELTALRERLATVEAEIDRTLAAATEPPAEGSGESSPR